MGPGALRWGFLGLLVTLGACQQDYTFRTYDAPNLDSTARLIQLEPAVLDLGQTDTLASSLGQVTIRNIGAELLYIDDITVEGSPHFSAQYPPIQYLEPGEETSVVVSYNPTEFESATAELVVQSSDPILPAATTGLAGRSAPPSIGISPVAFDFGLQFIGCTLDHQMTVTNYGEGLLSIDALGLGADNPDYRVAFDPPTSLPLNLAPGESWDILLDYRPSNDGNDEAIVQLHSNDPEKPIAEAYAYGQGRSEGHITDIFEQLANNRTDILFVIDNSFSMKEEQETLVCNFQSFLNIVESLGINYHIGVITTDNPVLSGKEKVITRETADPAYVFSLNADVGTEGQGQEQGYEMAKQALSAPLVTAQNEGFLRNEAGLRLIFVSDENDQSPMSVQEYLGFFRGLKLSPNQVIASAIVGDLAGGCGFENDEKVDWAPPPMEKSTSECPSQYCGRAISGERYIESVITTGGIFGSICSCNFIEALEDIAYETVHLVDTFPLSQTPNPDTLAVYVDDQSVENWHYDATQNAVVFPNQLTIPVNGSRIRVEYDLQAFCSD